MKKWDTKPTLILEAWIHELQGKPVSKGDSARKNAALVPVGSSPEREEGLVLLLILKGLLLHFYKKQVTNTMTRTEGALPPAR